MPVPGNRLAGKFRFVPSIADHPTVRAMRPPGLISGLRPQPLWPQISAVLVADTAIRLKENGDSCLTKLSQRSLKGGLRN